MDWINFVEIFLLLAACHACYNWGKFTGISGTIDLFLSKKLLTEKDLEKLKE